MASRPVSAGHTATAPSPTRSSGLRLVPLIALLLAVALTLGGGGVRYGLANLAVQLIALAILGLHRAEFLAFWKHGPTGLKTLMGLSLLIPALQLVPLPEFGWTALPGRDLVVQSREAAGLPSGWAPASLDPARTLVALTGMIVPLVILSVGWAAPRRHLMSVGWFMVVLGLICFAIGVPQVLSEGNLFQIYEERTSASLLLGTFANRNSTGLFLVCALAMAALLPLPLARPHPAALPVRLGICALLLVGVILTQSRSATALATIPVALGCLRAFAIWRSERKAQRGSAPDRTVALMLSAVAIGMVAVGTVLAVAPGRVGDLVERFAQQEDARTAIWEDAAYSADRFWPVGAGMGSFDEVYQVDESLESLSQRRAGRAHNDFIELGIEAGAAGLALAALWLVLVVWLAWRARLSQFRWAAWASAAILCAIALQSITDYPLRNQAMLATAAFAMLMLARIGTASSHETAG